jgi:hypothetical protein
MGAVCESVLVVLEWEWVELEWVKVQSEWE